jgi:hypothetical protein
MAILVGIDEAGYGPLLGPLVVSATAFQIPDDLLRGDHWTILKNAVGDHKKGLSGRILIADSKKAYTRSSGIGHLRKTVLTVLSCLRNSQDPLENIAALIDRLDPQCSIRLKEYPWYQQLQSHSLGHDASDIQIAGTVFDHTLSDNNMKLLAIQSRCLDVQYYNRHVERVRNKSRVLFTELCSLVLETLKLAQRPAETIQIVVDRQGGRINYQNELLRMFGGFGLTVIRQDPAMSSYELSGNGKTMRIHFCMKADTKYLPVALASMVSKYLREVLMEALNSYFCGLCDDLKPTAGYWQDGRRFITDINKVIPKIEYDQKRLIRIS